ncbi:MAG: hypothetical protein K0Q96_762 [Rubrobacteraceae bacterium]|nr:hypothetical protein [Rubrobacteraceae bacterium]
MERQTGTHDAWRRLDRIHLRNPYEVYQRGDSYRVVGYSPSGQDHTHRVVGEAVRYLSDKLRRRSVTASEAAEIIRPMAARFGLTYTYGNQVKYSAQSVLLVLVALGRASVEKDGRSFVYHIKG